jgi:hypothetical protein
MRTRSGSGNLDDVPGLETLRSLHHIEADAVALAQGLEPLRDDEGLADEDVRAALPHDEAKALVLVEPLHGTLLSHTLAPCLLFLPPGSVGWSLDRRQEKNPPRQELAPTRLRLLCTTFYEVRRDAGQQSRSFARKNPRLRRSPNSIRLC